MKCLAQQNCKHQETLERDQSDRGQALVETPIVVVAMSMLILLLFQPVAYLSAKMMVGYTAAHLARVSATDAEYGGGHHGALLKAIAHDKLAALPRTDLFYVPGSLETEIGGSPTSDFYRISVRIKQRPFPGLGALLGADQGGLISVEGATEVRGAHLMADMANAQDSLLVGAQ